jgi:hypothetical protein
VAPLSTPVLARYNTPVGRTTQQRDVIEDPEDENEDEDLHAHQSVENEEQRDTNDYMKNVGFEADNRYPKRRRLSTPGDEDMIEHEQPNCQSPNGPLSSPDPVLSPPHEPRTYQRPSSRFRLRATPPPATVSSHPAAVAAPTAFLKPPRFRPPDEDSHDQATEPLPEVFSPHRRGQKFIPGGLAAEVVGWLVNIESCVPGTGAGLGMERGTEERWAVRLVVDEVRGGSEAGIAGAGMTIVRGRQMRRGSGSTDQRVETAEMIDHLGIVKVILAGEGVGVGIQKAGKVEVGRIVGIKGPVWEVVIEQERWGVGVDWRVLN